MHTIDADSGDNLEELQRELEAAFSALSAIAVRGDDVDRMAEARAHLRSAWALTKKE